MIYAIGVDPDTHYLSWALVRVEKVGRAINSQCIMVGQFEVPRIKTGEESETLMIKELQQKPLQAAMFHNVGHIVVEGQQTYIGQAFRANDLIRLAHVAGAAAMLFSILCPQARLRIPRPQQWKGDVPKEIHQRRILAHTACDNAALDLYGSKKIHIIDAIGLAHWGACRYA